MKRLYKFFAKTIIIIIIIHHAILSFSNTSIATDEPLKAFYPDRLNQIDNVIKDAISIGEIPGAVVLVKHNGNEIYHKSFGFSDIAKQKEMKLNSIFRIASMSKAITSVGVMILYERGHFLLNDPISKFITEFKDLEILLEVDSLGNIIKTIPAKNEIRIIDLLTHTSGISYEFITNDLQKVYEKNGIIDVSTEKEITLAENMKLLSELPLLFEPGSQYQYGLNIDLLGYLCEVISKKPLNQFLEDEIFSPLKMVDTQFYLSENKKDRLANLYSWVDGKLKESQKSDLPIKIDNIRFPIEGAKTYFSGGGGLTSTVYDYGRFTQMLLNQGELDGVRLLSRKTIELITSPRVDTNNDNIPDITLGGFRVYHDIAKKGELFGSKGTYVGGGAFYGTFLNDSKENLSIVFMSQVLPVNSNVSDRLRVIVYQALK